MSELASSTPCIYIYIHLKAMFIANPKEFLQIFLGELTDELFPKVMGCPQAGHLMIVGNEAGELRVYGPILSFSCEKAQLEVDAEVRKSSIIHRHSSTLLTLLIFFPNQKQVNKPHLFLCFFFSKTSFSPTRLSVKQICKPLSRFAGDCPGSDDGGNRKTLEVYF